MNIDGLESVTLQQAFHDHEHVPASSESGNETSSRLTLGLIGDVTRLFKQPHSYQGSKSSSIPSGSHWKGKLQQQGDVSEDGNARNRHEAKDREALQQHHDERTGVAKKVSFGTAEATRHSRQSGDAQVRFRNRRCRQAFVEDLG